MEEEGNNESKAAIEGKIVKVPRDVEASLYYSRALSSTPPSQKWFIDTLSSPPSKLSNFENIPVRVKIRDLRGSESSVGLDTTGFQPLHSPTSVEPKELFSGDARLLQEHYYPEMELLLKQVTGAGRVFIFDHTIRRDDALREESELYRQPVLRVHADQTPTSALARILTHLGPNARSFTRYQIINVWRPIGCGRVWDYPLAMADFRSLDPSRDLIPTDLIYPAWLKDKETFAVKYDEGHRWYYWSGMGPEEVLLVKCYDTASAGLQLQGGGAGGFDSPPWREGPQGVAGCSPHTAFFDEEGATFGTKRESIEVRAMVFHD